MGFHVGALYRKFVPLVTNRNGEVNWPASGVGAEMPGLRNKLEVAAGSGSETT